MLVHAKASCNQMLTLTRDILDMDKLDAGMITLSCSDFSLSELFQECACALSFIAEKKE